MVWLQESLHWIIFYDVHRRVLVGRRLIGLDSIEAFCVVWDYSAYIACAVLQIKAFHSELTRKKIELLALSAVGVWSLVFIVGL